MTWQSKRLKIDQAKYKATRLALEILANDLKNNDLPISIDDELENAVTLEAVEETILLLCACESNLDDLINDLRGEEPCPSSSDWTKQSKGEES